MSLEERIKDLTKSIDKLISILSENSHSENNKSNINNLIPLTKWPDYHLFPTEASLRNMVFNERHNGASIWIVRMGRKILIDEKKFFEWLKTNPTLRP